MASRSPSSARTTTLKMELARACGLGDPAVIAEARVAFAVSRIEDHIRNLLGSCPPVGFGDVQRLLGVLEEYAQPSPVTQISSAGVA